MGSSDPRRTLRIGPRTMGEINSLFSTGTRLAGEHGEMPGGDTRERAVAAKAVGDAGGDRARGPSYPGRRGVDRRDHKQHLSTSGSTRYRDHATVVDSAIQLALPLDDGATSLPSVDVSIDHVNLGPLAHNGWRIVPAGV